VLFALV